MSSYFVVAIDGPAGSGMSTVSKMIAKRLHRLYIDTGAMYRAVAYKAMKLALDLHNGDELTRLAHAVKIELKESDRLHVYIDGGFTQMAGSSAASPALSTAVVSATGATCRNGAWIAAGIAAGCVDCTAHPAAARPRMQNPYRIIVWRK